MIKKIIVWLVIIFIVGFALYKNRESIHKELFPKSYHKKKIEEVSKKIELKRTSINVGENLLKVNIIERNYNYQIGVIDAEKQYKINEVYYSDYSYIKQLYDNEIDHLNRQVDLDNILINFQKSSIERMKHELDSLEVLLNKMKNN